MTGDGEEWTTGQSYSLQLIHFWMHCIRIILLACLHVCVCVGVCLVYTCTPTHLGLLQSWHEQKIPSPPPPPPPQCVCPQCPQCMKAWVRCSVGDWGWSVGGKAPSCICQTGCTLTCTYTHTHTNTCIHTAHTHKPTHTYT